MIFKLLLGGAAALTLSAAALAQTTPANASSNVGTAGTESASASPSTTTSAAADPSAGATPGPDTTTWTTPGVTQAGVAGGVAPYRPAGVAGEPTLAAGSTSAGLASGVSLSGQIAAAPIANGVP
jgi:hypothetical protein